MIVWTYNATLNSKKFKIFSKVLKLYPSIHWNGFNFNVKLPLNMTLEGKKYHMHQIFYRVNKTRYNWKNSQQRL